MLQFLLLQPRGPPDRAGRVLAAVHFHGGGSWREYRLSCHWASKRLTNDQSDFSPTGLATWTLSSPPPPIPTPFIAATRLAIFLPCTEVDEAIVVGEAPPARASRLARPKALSVGLECADAHLVIGSDQVACIEDKILRKPGSRASSSAARGVLGAVHTFLDRHFSCRAPTTLARHGSQ